MATGNDMDKNKPTAAEEQALLDKFKKDNPSFGITAKNMQEFEEQGWKTKSSVTIGAEGERYLSFSAEHTIFNKIKSAAGTSYTDLAPEERKKRDDAWNALSDAEKQKRRDALAKGKSNVEEITKKGSVAMKTEPETPPPEKKSAAA